MPEVKESEIYNALLRYKGKKALRIGNAEVIFSLNPHDTHKKDRPDGILWVEITLKIFGQKFNAKLPIPVEGEKVGIKDAIEDLNAFVEREHYLIEIPMIVISEAGYIKKEIMKKFPTKFTVKQIPIRRLKEYWIIRLSSETLHHYRAPSFKSPNSRHTASFHSI